MKNYKGRKKHQMKKTFALLLALSLGAFVLVSCTKASVTEPIETKASMEATTDANGQTAAETKAGTKTGSKTGTGAGAERTTAFPTPHLGETAKAEDGSVYAVGETVTAGNGEKRVAQPVTNPAGELVGVTLLTPEAISEQQSQAQAIAQAEAAYTGHTNRQRVTTTVVRGTSPNRLTTRPTLAETEPRSANLPETLPSYYVPETTVAPERVKVSYPGTLNYTENGVTTKYQIDRYEASIVSDSSAVTLTVHPLSPLSEATIVRIGYNCYDAQGKKLNPETLYTPAALNPNGSATNAIAPLPENTVRVEFFGN